MGYYRGWYEGNVPTTTEGMVVRTYDGKALALYLGGSYKISDVTQLSVELNPMMQRDNYFNRSAFIPSAKVGVSFALNERRYLEAQRTRKLKNQ